MNSPHMISLAALIAALLLAGCGEKEAASGGHDHGATAQAAGHADHGPEGEKLTHFSDKTELYVEFPTLVVGQARIFIASSRPADKLGRRSLVIRAGLLADPACPTG